MATESMQIHTTGHARKPEVAVTIAKQSLHCARQERAKNARTSAARVNSLIVMENEERD